MGKGSELKEMGKKMGVKEMGKRKFERNCEGEKVK